MSSALNYIPQAVKTPESTGPVSGYLRPVSAWLGLCLVAWFLIGMVVAAPLAQESGHPLIAGSIYMGFSRVCHQIAARSFFLEGYPLAVCARCFGLYLGFAGGATIYPVFRSLKRLSSPRRIWLFLAAVPIVIDFSLGFLGIWANTHTSRFLTGALLGGVSAFFVAPGILELARFGFKGSHSVDLDSEPINSDECLGIAPVFTDGPSDYGSPQTRI